MCDTHTHGPINPGGHVGLIGSPFLKGLPQLDETTTKKIIQIFSQQPTVNDFIPADKKVDYISLTPAQQVALMCDYITIHYTSLAGACYQRGDVARADQTLKEMKSKIDQIQREIYRK